MTSIETARDQIMEAFRTAWLASSEAAVPLEYVDVKVDTDSTPSASIRRPPFLRLNVQPIVGEQETLGGHEHRRFLNTLLFSVQVFSEPGDGFKRSDQLATIALRIMRRIRTAGVWGI